MEHMPLKVYQEVKVRKVPKDSKAYLIKEFKVYRACKEDKVLRVYRVYKA